MDIAPFRIHADPIGGTIEVNGHDITSEVAALELRVAPHQPTVLTLHRTQGGVIEGEGIVQVTAEQDDAAVVCAFLDRVDPHQWDQDALNSDLAHDLPVAMLEVLRRYARGEPCPT